MLFCLFLSCRNVDFFFSLSLSLTLALAFFFVMSCGCLVVVMSCFVLSCPKPNLAPEPIPKPKHDTLKHTSYHLLQTLTRQALIRWAIFLYDHPYMVAAGLYWALCVYLLLSINISEREPSVKNHNHQSMVKHSGLGALSLFVFVFVFVANGWVRFRVRACIFSNP